MAERRRQQSGASLILVLALVAFLALVVPAVLGLTLTGSKATVPVVEDRRELYAASSAIDAAVQAGRANADVGVPGGPCPEQTLSIDSLEVSVRCGSHPFPGDGCHYLDRFVTYTAEVHEPGDAAVLARTSAEVVYRYHDGDTTVEARQFTPDATGAVSTTALPPCPTVSTSSTTSTTSTTVPIPGSYAVWGAPSAENQSGNKWRAVATLDVTDQLGAAINGATVTVGVHYQKNGGPAWVADTNIVGVTTATGSVTFHSASYAKTGGNKVTLVRFTVLSVAAPGLTWISAAHPVSPPDVSPPP